MAMIIINDLPQSDELDREAMQSIAGGARTGVRPVQIDQLMAGSGRIVDYPPGFGRRAPIRTTSERADKARFEQSYCATGSSACASPRPASP